MKKIIFLILAFAMCLSLCACGSGNDTPETTEAHAEATTPPTEEQEQEVFFEVGKETVANNFTFTVNEIGFADSICIDKGDTLGLYSQKGSSVQANEGYGWLYYSISYKFTGSEKLSAQGQFLGSVQFGDHFFMTPNLRFFKYDGAWHGLDYQWGTGTSIGLPLPATDMMYQYDPWVEKDYELHGAVQVPLKAVEDTETPLILRLDFSMGGSEFEQVKCIVEIEPPAELTPDDRLLTFSYEDRVFFKEYVQTLTPMIEDEIRAVLTDNTFKMRNNYGGDGDGTHSITFYTGGGLDADYLGSDGQQYTMYESWAVKDGAIVLTNSFTNTYGELKTNEYIFTPYQYDNTRYLLIHNDGDFSMVLTAE